MKLAIGKFARFCIDAHLGEDITTGVQSALNHYNRRLKSGSTPIRFPDFCRDLESDRYAVSFELPVDREMQAMMGREARRHGTSIDQIVAHAVFVYLADLEAGSFAA